MASLLPDVTRYRKNIIPLASSHVSASIALRFIRRYRRRLASRDNISPVIPPGTSTRPSNNFARLCARRNAETDTVFASKRSFVQHRSVPGSLTSLGPRSKRIGIANARFPESRETAQSSTNRTNATKTINPVTRLTRRALSLQLAANPQEFPLTTRGIPRRLRSGGREKERERERGSLQTANILLPAKKPVERISLQSTNASWSGCSLSNCQVTKA